MKIKPNLHLNMSPQTTEDYGLAFARNMKLDDDGNLVSDYGFKEITNMASKNIVGHIVGLDNKVYFLCSTLSNGSWTNHKIWEYDEDLETVTEIEANWSYSGGEIDGYVSTNQSGEKILTIAEYVANGEVPLKHINLSYCTNNTNESLYCQAPKCPTANLVLTDTYAKSIPNGVYVFFIRYKIRKDVYTNWFLCSRPIYAGSKENITTLQGGLSYINLHKDSAKSFVFNLNFAQTANISSYKEFQLGFIITHDEATDARTWKHFDMSKFNPTGGTIYFDYEEVEETNVDDLLEVCYELYNVHNVTSFKNKLYISNYIESDFNPNIDSLASKIQIRSVKSTGEAINYKNLKFDGHTLTYNYTKGYYDTIAGGTFPTLVTDSSFLYDISNLTKTTSKEKEEVVKFDLFWTGNNDPDIAFVYNIYNYLYKQPIFGGDFTAPVEFTTAGLARLGVVEAHHGTNLWVYERSNTKHPWDDLGFTFAFGSAREDEIGQTWCRNGCSFFDASTYGNAGGGGHYGWVTRDAAFSNAAFSAMDARLKAQIKSKSFFAKAYLQVTSGANTYNIGYDSNMELDNYAGKGDTINVVPLSDDEFSTETISTSLRNKIISWIAGNGGVIKTNIVGIDDSGNVVLSIDGNIIKPSSISVVFKKFEFDVDSEDIDISEGNYIKRFSVKLKTTDYVSLCTFRFKSELLVSADTASNVSQTSTLMPLSSYDVYVHFVDEHNIITNGKKITNTPITTTFLSNDKETEIITLQYKTSNDFYSSAGKFSSFFFSIVNVGNIIIEGFGYTRDTTSPKTHILHCIELDALLYNLNDNIKIVDGNNLVIGTGKYYSSGTNYPILAFGNCGYVTWTTVNDIDYSTTKLYISIERNKSAENIDSLVKSSAYIPIENKSNYVDIPDGYYQSWLCLIKKPDFELSSSCYVAGNDVYAINRTAALSLTEFKNYIQVQNSPTYVIRSNFNLNYLSLTEDIADKIFPVGRSGSAVKQVAKVINSATLSSIYELKSMYRDFANKYFRKYDTDYKIDFDNTIRVSHVLSDETFNNSVFKFSAEDYYNVPTDRGIIVNLFAISNNIFVHTKGSFYKFDGNQTLVTNNSNDVQLQESEPFELGITQLFDSEYGYGGIENKQSGCITFDSYFFYDRASNHIFGYSGNAQIQMIDANIYKTLAYYKPIDCRTLHDEANCRILFEFITNSTNEYKTFTLSFNYKTKTFISLHDLSLINAFASRHKDYSYKVNTALINLFDTSGSISTTPLSDYGTFMNVNNIFGTATTPCMIEFGAAIYKAQATPFGIAVVVMPRQTLREAVDSVKYISDIISPCIEVRTKTTEGTSVDIYDVLAYPQTTRTNPVVNFYIITNTCISSLITTTVDDTSRPDIDHTNPDDDRRDKPNDPNKAYTTLMDYKGFKYDMGFWACNYFRNKYFEDDAHKDVYSYGVPYPNRNLNSDLNSLVYGRYFILNFDFKADTPIKFEEIFVNSDKY